MRTHTLITAILVSAFLALAAGAALAQAPENRANERAAAAAEMREARNESLRMFKENRTAALAEYHATINATRASFLENKTLVIDGCRAQRNESATDNNSAYAKCVRDGLKPLIEAAREAHADARETARAKMVAARDAAKAAFESSKASIRARHAAG